MKDIVGVRKLVELIFDKKFEVTSEMIKQDSSFPPCLLTNDFAQKLSHVLSVRKSIIHIKWMANFNVFYDRDVLSDHKSYLVSIIFNCLIEHKCQSNVFESFLSVCSCVDFYSDETLRHAGLNYCDFNTDIVMEIFESVLEQTFVRRKGFKRLVEYISKHKYLAWDLELVKRVVHEDTSDRLVVAMEKRILNQISSERKTGHSFNFDVDGLKTSAAAMAQCVLLTTSVQLPTFSSDHDSNQMVNPRLDDAAKKYEVEGTIEADLQFEPVEISHCCSSPYAKTNLETKQPDDIEWYEGVVQAVIKYNQSKTTDLESSDNSIQKRAGEVLEHLKDIIKSLIKLLDENDE